jgi:hypothetical protein
VTGSERSGAAHMGSMTETNTPGLDIDALEATARAAANMAPGPWFWGGNTDHEEPSLNCIVPRLGRVEVLGHCPVDRVRDSFEARQYIEDLENSYGTQTEENREACLLEWLWADEAYEVPNTDSRLTVTDERNVKQPVRDLAVYDVARIRGLPDDTKREHDGIHRGNIVDVHSPIARHLAAASPETVLALIARVREQEQRIQEAVRIHTSVTVHYDQWRHEFFDDQGHGGHCGLCRDFDGVACPTVVALVTQCA